MIYKRMFDYEKIFLEYDSIFKLEWMDYDTRVFKMPLIFKRAVDLMFKCHTLTYSDFGGIKRLRELIITYEKHLTGCQAKEAPFSLVGSGVNNLIYPVLKSVLKINQNKKEVVLFVPDYPIFHSVVEAADAVPIIVRSSRENNFLPTIEQIEKVISENTSAILFSNPNNPTGKMFSPKWLRKIVHLSQKYDFFILSDEIYIEALYEENKPLHFAKINNGYKNYVKFFGLSKDRPGMTGIRCGYCIGDRRLLDGAEREQITRNISNGIISDYFLLLDIALRYLNISGIRHDDLKYYTNEEIEGYNETVSSNKKLQHRYNNEVIQQLSKNQNVIDIISPDGGNAVFFRYFKNLKAEEFLKEFLLKGLASYPGEAFMLNSYSDGAWTRICVTRAIDKLKESIKKI